MCPLLNGFFHSVGCPSDPSKLSRVSIVPSFLSLCNRPLSECAMVCFSHTPTQGPLSCFQLLVMMKEAAVTIHFLCHYRSSFHLDKYQEGDFWVILLITTCVSDYLSCLFIRERESDCLITLLLFVFLFFSLLFFLLLFIPLGY